MRAVAKNEKIWKSLLCGKLIGHVKVFFQETAGVFLKTPIGYRAQSMLSCKIARKVYKKLYKQFENRKKDFSLSLSRSDEFFTHKNVNFQKSILHAY